ncbi:hypothetical protein VTK56DRAFT_9254 [Thermocarpiscus australiensis]
MPDPDPTGPQAAAAAEAGFPDRGPAVFAVTTATLALASVFVGARMVSRVMIVRRSGWDDYIMALAWVLALCLSVSVDWGTRYGLGKHEGKDDDVGGDNERRQGLRMCEYVFSIFYNPALMATKTSILIFYLRLAKNTQQLLRLASWAVLGIVNVAGVILTFMNIFQCHPINAAWDIHVTPVRCIPLLTEFICSAPVNVVTDLAILALPIPVLTSMRLPCRQKTILVLTFALGIFVTVVDVIRIYYLQQAIEITPTSASSDPQAMFGQSAGFSWNASLSLMWSAVEVNVGIICACIPTLKPLVVRLLPAMLFDPDGTRRTSSKPSVTDDSQPHAGVMQSDLPLNAHQHPTPSAARPDGRISDEISIREFLSSSPGDPTGTGRGSRRTASNDPSSLQTSVYFGFVNMKRPKSMLQTSAAESFKYCTVVSILFFLWGFSYGLLNTLNNVVAEVANMSTAQTLGLTSIYFGGGYFAGPLLVGEWLLRHDEHHRTKRGKKRRDTAESIGGFKATFIAGLLIYGTGTIMFWPSAVLAAYGGFMVSSFVVGFGLAVLETGANPFLVLCGPRAYGDARLLLAQGVQAVGSVLSGLLADRVYFGPWLENRPVGSATLIDVQWTYLAVTLLSVLLALFFYYMPLPEVTDAELAALARRLPVDATQRSIAGLSLRTWALALAVFSQWTYVAAQENTSLFFHELLTSLTSPASLPLLERNLLLLCHAAFATSRFLAGFLAALSARFPFLPFLPTPPTILLLSSSLSALMILLTILLPRSPPPPSNLNIIPLVLIFFFEAPIWCLTFSLGLRGQGARTKRAAAWLTMAASGPAFWPFVSYAVLRQAGGGGGIRIAFVPTAVLMAAVGLYPAFVLVWGRGVVETRGTGQVGMDDGAVDEKRGDGGRVDGGEVGREEATSAGADSRRGLIVNQGEAQQAPWESQVLDTRILQD